MSERAVAVLAVVAFLGSVVVTGVVQGVSGSVNVGVMLVAGLCAFCVVSVLGALLPPLRR